MATVGIVDVWITVTGGLPGAFGVTIATDVVMRTTFDVGGTFTVGGGAEEAGCDSAGEDKTTKRESQSQRGLSRK